MRCIHFIAKTKVTEDKTIAWTKYTLNEHSVDGSVYLLESWTTMAIGWSGINLPTDELSQDVWWTSPDLAKKMISSVLHLKNDMWEFDMWKLGKAKEIFLFRYEQYLIFVNVILTLTKLKLIQNIFLNYQQIKFHKRCIWFQIKKQLLNVQSFIRPSYIM